MKTDGLDMNSHTCDTSSGDGSITSSNVDSTASGTPLRINSFDFETTGKDPTTARVWQFATLSSSRANSLSLSINPQEIIPKEVQDLCHLDDTKLPAIYASPTFGEVAGQLTDSLRNCDVLISYNGEEYDISVLNHELARCGMPTVTLPPHIDVLILGREFWPDLPSHSLVNLYKALAPNDTWLQHILKEQHIDLEANAHGAMFDCALEMCILKLMVYQMNYAVGSIRVTRQAGEPLTMEHVRGLIQMQRVFAALQKQDAMLFGVAMLEGAWFKWLRTCRGCLGEGCNACEGVGAVMHTKKKRGQPVRKGYAKWALSGETFDVGTLPVAVRQVFQNVAER